MTDWFLFVLAVMATFRISLMFSKEEGPGHIFAILRRKPPPRSSAREGLSCIFCESVWWSAVATIALGCMGEIAWRFAPFYWLAVSAGAVVLNQTFTRGEL